MNHLFKLGAVAALLGATAGLVRAAPDTASETRPVDAQVVRVTLEGVGDLVIRQGATATLVLTGDARLLSRTTTTQRGDTLNIETEGRRGGFNFGRSSGIQAELVLPNLRAVSSESIGATTVSGFAGQSLDINLDGAGSMSVSSSNYRFITANLGGVGNLKINGIDSEGIDLNWAAWAGSMRRAAASTRSRSICRGWAMPPSMCARASTYRCRAWDR
jgi:hypothetical protein